MHERIKLLVELRSEIVEDFTFDMKVSLEVAVCPYYSLIAGWLKLLLQADTIQLYNHLGNVPTNKTK